MDVTAPASLLTWNIKRKHTLWVWRKSQKFSINKYPAFIRTSNATRWRRNSPRYLSYLHLVKKKFSPSEKLVFLNWMSELNLQRLKECLSIPPTTLAWNIELTWISSFWGTIGESSRENSRDVNEVSRYRWERSSFKLGLKLFFEAGWRGWKSKSVYTPFWSPRAIFQTWESSYHW